LLDPSRCPACLLHHAPEDVRNRRGVPDEALDLPDGLNPALQVALLDGALGSPHPRQPERMLWTAAQNASQQTQPGQTPVACLFPGRGQSCHQPASLAFEAFGARRA
jgi:hypothetical protein